MRVKRAAPDIRLLDDVLNNDVFVSLICEEGLKRGEDCLSRLFAASFHTISFRSMDSYEHIISFVR